MQCHAFRYTNASSWSMQTNLLLICHSDRFQRMLSSSAGNYSIATPSEHQHSSHELTTRNQPEKKAAVLWTPAVIHAIRAAAKQGTLFGLSFPHVVGTKTILGVSQGGSFGPLVRRQPCHAGPCKPCARRLGTFAKGPSDWREGKKRLQTTAERAHFWAHCEWQRKTRSLVAVGSPI